MLITMRYQNGTRVEAVLLAAARERMRIAIDTKRDTVELNRVDGTWQTEEGDAVEIESLIPLAGFDIAAFCAEVYPLSNTAG